MKTITKIATLLFILGTFTSCGLFKKDVSGCTNMDATNYNDEADNDDGSCLFDARLLLWFTSEVETNSQFNGVDEFNIYIDGELEKVHSKFDNWDLQPDCGQAGVLQFTIKDIEENSSRDVVVRFTRPIQETTITNTIVNVTAGSCTKRLLNY